MEPAERMRALLRYANYTHVAQGLTAAGYPVSGPTVSRWAQGRNVTELAVRHVSDLLEEARNAPTPDWAQGLEIQLDEMATKLDAFDEWHRRADEREQGRVVEAATQGALEAVRQFLAENDIRPSANGEHDPEPAAEDPQPR